MPRPQPIIIPAGHFNPTSPRYRYHPVAVREATNQAERIAFRFGEDFLAAVRDLLDNAQVKAALAFREEHARWKAKVAANEDAGPEPKVSFGVDVWDLIASVLSGVQAGLTGTTLTQLQTEHFLASQVEVEVGEGDTATWVRLVCVVDGGLNHDGWDWDTPAEDVLPLWWMLVEVILLPLFQALLRRMKPLLDRMKAGDSSTPSSQPAAPDSSAA